MSPRRLIILTMSLCGLFAGLAGSIEILTLGYYPAVFGTSIGFAGITVALLGRAHPVGILLAALLLGGMRAGAPAMQITADIPIEIIDVIQGLILLFLAAEVVIRRTFRIRAERVTPGELGTVAKTYGRARSDGRPVRHPGPRVRAAVHRLPDRRDHDDEPRSSDPAARRRPIALGALCGIMNERSGIVNIGIEGMMLTAAFVGFMVAMVVHEAMPATEPTAIFGFTPALVIGILAAIGAGMLVSALHAWLCVTVRADQIISGTVINIIALGLTGYLNRLIAADRERRHARSVPPARLARGPADRRLDLPACSWRSGRSRCRSSCS